MLQVPAVCELRRVWMGLDHSAETIRRQLLQWGVSVQFHAEVSSYSSSSFGRSSRKWWALLRPQAHEQHLHAIFRSRSEYNIRNYPWHGSGQLRLFIATAPTIIWRINLHFWFKNGLTYQILDLKLCNMKIKI